MKNTKFISAALAGIMIFLTGAVSAEDRVLLNEPVFSGRTVTISGNVSAPNEKIYIEVTRKDANVLVENSVYAAYQVISDENGEFSYEYNMPEMSREDNSKYSDGYFTVYAFAAGYDSGDVDFPYVSETGREDFFENLNAAMASKDLLCDFFEDEDNKVAFLTYDILIDEIGGYSPALLDKMCGLLVEEGYVFNEGNISQINEFVYLMRLNGITDKTAAQEILESEEIAARCSLVYNDIEFDTLEGGLLDWFLKLFVLTSEKNGFDSFEQAEELFEDAYLLKQVNKAHYSDLYGVLFNNKTGLDLDGFESFTKLGQLEDTRKQYVMQKLKEESGEIVSISDLKSFITSAYNKYGNSNGNNNDNPGTTNNNKGPGGAYVVGSIGTDVGGIKQNEVDNDKVYFTDIENFEWAEEYINKLAANGIISGNGSGQFEPERKVTRAEFLKMLLGALDLVSDTAECSFEDVSKTDWSYPYIASAFSQGITSGIDDNNFGKDNLITRQEAAAFMHRGAVRTFIPMEQNRSSEFSDSDKIAPWAKRSINILYGAGLINGMGDNRFEPDGYTTRAQAAKMVCSLFDLL